ncbi:maleylpyruvate isomerase family mycothiol-dependent enzyme [Kineosporia succinea]|uniref:Uncharacterized protein (TIGR03083 family) n=1 Tax=Kineosporia succinea TaxID=84632 RepID=A0ABT9PAG1_9ACTN|nr:maleylpyruvate isomerase family mycothiol-dependent enzyme [Kineosporia succinea]MDP9829687.1 uncharacterized protein (TIGR03083 family) [Kineosporia succinea]
MRVHDLLVEQRRAVADVLASLPPEHMALPSLCSAWTIHEVAAHLTTYLRLAQPKIYLGIALTAGDLDRWNLILTRRAARRDDRALVGDLRRRAGSTCTIPFSGYDPVLADVVLHDLDIRRPLGIRRTIPEPALHIAFDHLAQRPVPGYAVGSRLSGLRLTAHDTGWCHGDGPVVTGSAEDLVLAMAGRPAGLAGLSGEGLPILRTRIRTATKAPVRERMLRVARVIVEPAPLSRRSRRAGLPT